VIYYLSYIDDNRDGFKIRGCRYRKEYSIDRNNLKDISGYIKAGGIWFI